MVNFSNLKDKCRNKTLLGIGPVSRAVTKAAIDLVNEKDVPILLIPSRRQVECNNFGPGYVYETHEFAEYIRKEDKKGNIILARDHGGPYQGIKVSDDLKQEMDDAKYSYLIDINAGFDIIHIDPSIKGKGFDDVVSKIRELYEYCEKTAAIANREIIYEVGTEEHGSYNLNSVEDFEKLAEICSREFPKVKFIVGNTGPWVKETFNVHGVSVNTTAQMVDICDRYGLFLKEHNLDYTHFRTLAVHPFLGIHSANVAPEFGTEQTRIFLESLLGSGMFFEYEEFIELCFYSNKWNKWMFDSEKAPIDRRQLAIICGHYLMENDRVKQITEILRSKSDYDKVLQQHLQAVMKKYLTAFGWIK